MSSGLYLLAPHGQVIIWGLSCVPMGHGCYVFMDSLPVEFAFFSYHSCEDQSLMCLQHLLLHGGPSYWACGACCTEPRHQSPPEATCVCPWANATSSLSLGAPSLQLYYSEVYGLLKWSIFSLDIWALHPQKLCGIWTLLWS